MKLKFLMCNMPVLYLDITITVSIKLFIKNTIHTILTMGSKLSKQKTCPPGCIPIRGGVLSRCPPGCIPQMQMPQLIPMVILQNF